MHTRNASFFSKLLLALLLLAAGGAVFHATGRGVGIMQDSTEYVGAARSLLDGRGLMMLGSDGALEPMTRFPPLLSLVYAGVARAGLDSAVAARWVHILLFPADLLLLWLMIRACTRNPWVALGGVLVFASSPGILPLNLIADSEPLFFLLAFGSLLLLACESIARAWPVLLAAAVLAALALLARYVGVVLIGVGGVAVLFNGSGRLSRRAARAIVFVAIACLPLGVWMIHQKKVAQNATARTIAYHPIEAYQVRCAFDTAEGWLVPPAQTRFRRVLLTAVILTLGALGAMILIGRRRRKFDAAIGSPAPPALPASPMTSRMIFMMILLAISYSAFILLTALLVDATTNPDARILCPVYAALLVLGCVVVDRALRAAGSMARPRIAGLVALAMLFLLAGPQILAAARLLKSIHPTGQFFACDDGFTCPAMEYARSLPGAAPVYSNGPCAIWFSTGRQARGLPCKYDRLSLAANPSYQRELADMVQNVRERHGAIIYFTAITYMSEMPDAAELETLAPWRRQQIPGAQIYYLP